MTLADLARKHLPAQAQDLLRTFADAALPNRRGEIARARSNVQSAKSLAEKVAPDGRVVSGIFKGMWMPVDASWGGLSARLAGSYEEELVSQLRQFIDDTPPVVVDAGCAEGYYAVGLALVLPNSAVYAFDIDRQARRLCRQAGKRNGLENLHVHGRINPPRLERLLAPGAMVVADVEGYEIELLNPQLVPSLRQANILVELHEFLFPGLTRQVLDRFIQTHGCMLINAEPRDGAAYAHLGHLTPAEAHAAVQEGRPTEPHPQQWAVLRPR